MEKQSPEIRVISRSRPPAMVELSELVSLDIVNPVRRRNGGLEWRHDLYRVTYRYDGELHSGFIRVSDMAAVTDVLPMGATL